MHASILKCILIVVAPLMGAVMIGRLGIIGGVHQALSLSIILALPGKSASI
jgi:hypothetical protein